MRFSIIVPIYKVEKYLAECIESVVRQEINDWELILVDDGSPDNCPAICDSYAEKDSRIKVVHKQNGGLVSARKAGLEIASGEYAICLDGDDFLSPKYLFSINNIIGKYYPDVICFGFLKYYLGQVKEFPIHNFRYGYYDRKAIENEIINKFIYSKEGYRIRQGIWCKAYNMEIYKKYQMKVSSDIKMGEDGACIYPLICNANSLYIMSECLYYYRQVNTSMTRLKKPLSWDNHNKIFECYKEGMSDSYELIRSQLYRLRTHSLFTICVSQFYDKSRTYRDSVKDIKKHFEDNPEYKESVINSDFTAFHMNFEKYVLKYNLFTIMYIYSKLKKLFLHFRPLGR